MDVSCVRLCVHACVHVHVCTHTQYLCRKTPLNHSNHSNHITLMKQGCVVCLPRLVGLLVIGANQITKCTEGKASIFGHELLTKLPVATRTHNTCSNPLLASY